MVVSKRKVMLMALGLFAVVGLTQIILESYADARAGGGRSGGFRGSRSYSSPSKPSQPSQTQQRREATPGQQPGMMPQSGGFMRGLGTAVLGGFLGSMLFSGLANAVSGVSADFGGSGFGMMEILLLGGLAYFLYRKFRSPAAAASGFGSMQYQNSQPYTQYTPASAPAQEAPAINDQIDYRSLTLMDRSFDPDRFPQNCAGYFLQGSRRLEQAGYRGSELALRPRADANLGRRVEPVTRAQPAKSDGEYRPARK